MQMVEGGVTVAAEEETESSSQQQVSRQFDDDDSGIADDHKTPNTGSFESITSGFIHTDSKKLG
jgi:hypothetical protein